MAEANTKTKRSEKQITAKSKSIFSAVALQDHFTKNLNFDDGKPKKVINYPLPVKKKQSKYPKKKSVADNNNCLLYTSPSPRDS